MLTIDSCTTHKMSEVVVQRLVKVKVGTHKVTSKVTQIEVAFNGCDAYYMFPGQLETAKQKLYLNVSL